MCGIFGFLQNTSAGVSHGDVRRVTVDLLRLSESRGKEAAGVAVRTSDEIRVFKRALPAHALMRQARFRQAFAATASPICIAMGHSRLVTHGSQQVADNNQPVIKDRLLGIHNGIVVNAPALWAQFPDLRQEYAIDTEILLALINHFCQKEPGGWLAALQRVWPLLEGTVSVALMHAAHREVILATNHGSLYIGQDAGRRLTVFASEAFILERAQQQTLKRYLTEPLIINQLKPHHAAVINPAGMDVTVIPLRQEDQVFSHSEAIAPVAIRVFGESKSADVPAAVVSHDREMPAFAAHYATCAEQVDALRRCTRCILPETMPFIDFDESGICHYCRMPRPQRPEGLAALRQRLTMSRLSGDRRPDCCVALSGGRDSSYTLHVVCRELGLRPVAYTYDWGMVNDLARRNQARLCGRLGVEHVIVSADIRRKRENIRRNVTAWLKRPELGMVPLFMAGDKQYFSFARQVQRRTGTDLIIMGENPYEKTHFKTGFCGVREASADLAYNLHVAQKCRLGLYYLGQLMRNPAYCNRSLWDSARAFVTYFHMAHTYLNVFDYVPWDEQEITTTLQQEYDWETADDTDSTWRIGDGTAPFYNYIYYTVAGMTEHDTLRSQQVREGVLKRTEALVMVKQENRPRFAAIRWYCHVTGLDFVDTIRRIQQIPRLYGLDQRKGRHV